MIATIGAALMASAVVVFAWAYGQYRRPVPASWTESETVTVSIALATMGLLLFVNFRPEAQLLLPSRNPLSSK